MTFDMSAFIQEIIDAENRVIEEWIEKSLQDGVRGVKIIRVNGTLSEIGLSSEVPYGNIHEHISWQ